ncbi:MAG: adenosylcobalamin-dependent ribonucleoside-diphosphate reductase [Rhodoferax sp.]|uniref:adenosylcobalamin-dependent ribonucleoside-diphosphate reductase n=1 Tax=Rhodoferax sp. TaxID=50421 RepID=UPI00183C4E5F|nr:adenosylcobalamin-dependent ribonucleoside-diphosphate reductase [Rhodoferax sp.]NMM15041.1 adenosylcobalamin-dependent ribonucleoside-diphosphate reductase [Rhodoferax sp.]NMM21492.1 adenosylcobalamin-dependent ribonucleoside-diphosphate reductase [Rhodoferax sp.]
MQTNPFHAPISEHVWRTKYQWCEGGHMQEPSIEATWDRVALAVSGAEAHHHNDWRERFRAILSDFRFLPAGRILAGAATSRSTTLFNCFVMGPMEDSIPGIFNALRDAMVTLQAGGGVGIDFSTLRPAGALALSSGGVATGPVSFMAIWDEANAVLETNNLRRGAMMATLRCDHPDIESFIDSKIAKGALPHFKMSVLVTDEFMRAVEEDGPWPLVFPLGGNSIPVGGEVCERVWSGGMTPQLCLVHRRLPARALWEKLLEAQYTSSEPAVLFIDRINSANNLWYCENLYASNPFGEIPLPPYGACNLGSLNLTRFVQHPFAEHPRVDFGDLRAVASVATRFLDNVHDISLFPLKAQEKAAGASRRIGLGVTGLADMFAMLGLRYGSQASINLTHQIMSTIRDTAYRTSIAIAQEKGAFPEFDKIKYGASPFVLALSHDIQDAISQHGIRNSHLLAVAPTGSISLLANNVSSGIEPIHAFKTQRCVRGADGQEVTFDVEDAAWYQYKALHGASAVLPAHFVQSADVCAEDQLHMMAMVQSCVDNAISKSLVLPESASAQDIGLVLLQAWELGLKGISVFRTGPGS